MQTTTQLKLKMKLQVTALIIYVLKSSNYSVHKYTMKPQYNCNKTIFISLYYIVVLILADCYNTAKLNRADGNRL